MILVKVVHIFMDSSLPGSSVHGIFQAIVLEWIAISFSRGSSRPRNWTQVSCIAGRRFTIWATREARLGIHHLIKSLTVQFSSVAQSCPTLCDPMDCVVYSIRGILQARILEWVAISFSRGSSRPRDRTQVSRIRGRCFNLWATREALKWE